MGKAINQSLHNDSVALLRDKRRIVVQENVLSEATILKYLTNQRNAPCSIVKLMGIYQCEKYYYLILEDAGHDLFKFVKRAHSFIKKGYLDIPQWHNAVKIIFRQMLESVEFIHGKNICHHDISLENYLINDVKIVESNDGRNNHTKISFVEADISIKLIDFGLATVYIQDSFQSIKFVGKCGYQCPRIEQQKTYNAKSNDVWGLGVCLFKMIVGSDPFRRAHPNDDLYSLIMNGHLIKVIKNWNRLHYVNQDLINLFQLFFQPESERITLSEIKQHPWLK